MGGAAVNDIVVVAGGAGFIGSHLCDFLVSKGESVLCIDSLITGDKANIVQLAKARGFRFVRKDISGKFSVPGKVKQIYNLASPASPVDYSEKPLETLDAGSLGVKNLLELAKSKKASFLFASTSEVYGNPLEHPQKETYFGNVNPVGPRSCYDESKRFGEALCAAYQKTRGVDIKIARIFNTYGPRMRRDDGRVVPNFITQALANSPITVYGAGSQTRSFCHVSDMVAGLYVLMNSAEHGPVNIGNPHEITVLDLAKTVIRLVGSSSEIVFRDIPADDPERRMPDIGMARRVLAWEPEIGLEEGLMRTIPFFK